MKRLLLITLLIGYIYVALVRITIYLESGGLFINDCSFK